MKIRVLAIICAQFILSAHLFSNQFTCVKSGLGSGQIRFNGVLHTLPYTCLLPAAGTVLTIEAVPDGNSKFVLWNGTVFGRDYNSTDNPISIIVAMVSGPASDIYISVNFALRNIAREQDSLALVALYNSTQGTGWTNHTNWLSTNPLDTWFGVLVEDNRVRRLYLSRNNVSGSIPPEIGNLTNLISLELDHNSLDGSIPPEVGNLTKVGYLNLRDNSTSVRLKV